MKTVLVIDDDVDLLATICTSLQRHGFDVLPANNAHDGLKLALTRAPDLILSDVVMGDLGGYDLLHSLRQQPLTAHTPVILMTGMADLQGLRKGMELGADDYLPKPFNLDELIRTVSSRLERKVRLQEASEKQLAELRSNLTSMLPHELLTPLNGILGAAEVLELEAATAKPEVILEMAGSIKESGQRLHRLVQRFLLYAQIELAIARTPGAEVECEWAEADQVVQRAARECAVRCFRLDDLKLQTAPVTANICADYLLHTVEELVDNAAKFSAPGTPIEVRFSRVDSGMELRVRDQGVGMQPEEIQQAGAFVQFNRRLREQQGTGLGLILARRLTGLLGGSLQIQQASPKGTEVIVRIPL